MEVKKATVAQVRMGRGGRLIEVDDDVFDVCRRIREVDASLGVEFNEQNEQFRIYELGWDGKKRTVFWTPELTPNIPDHLRRLAKETYVRELERLDAKAEREADHRFHETLGPVGEKMHHAIGKDKGWKHKTTVPRALNADD